MKEKTEEKRPGFTSGFGPHLVLDGYDCNKEKLEDISLIYGLLDEFPGKIGMTKIMPPYVFKYSGLKPEDWGISGFVLIAESHISLHTFPEKNYLSLDIFSCKNFDTLKAINYIQNIFEIKKYDHNILSRGLEFPKNIEIVTKHIRRERGKMVTAVRI